ncbi:MAG: hypothetical protein Q9208_002175 [Pyrenodesmia sp. 3 TL-2023]
MQCTIHDTKDDPLGLFRKPCVPHGIIGSVGWRVEDRATEAGELTREKIQAGRYMRKPTPCIPCKAASYECTTASRGAGEPKTTRAQSPKRPVPSASREGLARPRKSANATATNTRVTETQDRQATALHSNGITQPGKPHTRAAPVDGLVPGEDPRAPGLSIETEAGGGTAVMKRSIVEISSDDEVASQAVQGRRKRSKAQHQADKAPVKTPVKTPMKTPVKTPVKTPAETPAKTAVKTPAKTPAETPAETPVDVWALLRQHFLDEMKDEGLQELREEFQGDVQLREEIRKGVEAELRAELRPLVLEGLRRSEREKLRKELHEEIELQVRTEMLVIWRTAETMFKRPR